MLWHHRVPQRSHPTSPPTGTHCLAHPQIWLKSCLNIMEYRLGKYQGMGWSVGSTVLSCVRLCLVPPGPKSRRASQIVAAYKYRVCGSQSDLALAKHTPGRTKNRRSQIYHRIRHHIQNLSSAYLQLEIAYRAYLRIEHTCLAHQQKWLKSCLMWIFFVDL